MTARRWITAFAVWTGYCWGTRIKNALGDDTSTSVTKAAIVVWSMVLVFGALALLVAARSTTLPRQRIVDVVLAVTVASWTASAISMLVGGRGAAFIAVHLTLAAVSIALGVQAHRSTSSASVRQRQPPPAFKNSPTEHSTTS
ncbi:MAG: hypothetical protein ACR2LQ_07085 [Acidimicrobiales bacterium]